MKTILQMNLRRIDILFAAFLLLLTFQYAIPGSYPLTFSLVELGVFAALLYLLIASPGFLPSLVEEIRSDWIAGLLTLWAAWASVLWLVSKDWGYNLNEIRWLYLSVGAYILFRRAFRTEGERLLWVFLGISALVALIADIQGVTRLFTPPFTSLLEKDFYTAVDVSHSQTVAVGFFQHPNAFGGYIFWPLMICLGLLAVRRYRWIGAAGVIFFGLSLYLSYYRTLLLGVAFAFGLFLLLRLHPSARTFAWLALGAAVLAVAASVLALRLAPSLTFFENLWFRINLWHDVSVYIGRRPGLLLYGAGLSPSHMLSTSQARADPHNAYLYMLMHYGLPGLGILLALIWVVLRRGWLAYRDGLLREQPVLGALWVGLIAWFLTDLIDSRVTTAEWQMLFVLILAVFAGGLVSIRSANQGGKIGRLP